MVEKDQIKIAGEFLSSASVILEEQAELAHGAGLGAQEQRFEFTIELLKAILLQLERDM